MISEIYTSDTESATAMPYESDIMDKGRDLPFHDKLRIIRQAHRYTRQQFADLVGLSYGQLKNMERGEQRIPIDIAEKIDEHFPELTVWFVTSSRNSLREHPKFEKLQEWAKQMEKEFPADDKETT